MSLDVLPENTCKSLRLLIFDVKLPRFGVEHGVCLCEMHYYY
jgi:hypothetical protein